MSGNGAREVVLAGAVRTAVGRGHLEKGYYRDLHPSTLLADTYRGLFEQTGLEPADVDGVVCGCVQQLAEQGLNVGRNAWLEAGLPIEVPATTVDLQCGSAQQALSFATAVVASGAEDVFVAAGVEHMGHVSFAVAEEVQARHGRAHSPALLDRYGLVNQGLAAEMVADHWEVPRSELDELALRSHHLADRATEEGRFERELVGSVGGQAYVRDQGIRPSTSLEALAGLRPAFKEDGKITAGNSSQISDGAAAALVTTRERAGELGLTPRARIVDQVTVGVDPVMMLTGPIPATRRVLERNGMTIGDVDLVEINEAFAPVVAAWLRETGAELDRVNVNGGAMALGHPLGSTGIRLVTTLLHELERSDKELGLVTMCCAGGLGTATLVQRL